MLELCMFHVVILVNWNDYLGIYQLPLRNSLCLMSLSIGSLENFSSGLFYELVIYRDLGHGAVN
jgi:hypothetical protein